MNINTQALVAYLRKRKQDKKYELKPIGTAIRFKRKEMNMTLEEAAEGICSVSYLSKLENNQIEVSDKFIDQLLNRFSIETVYGENHEHYLEHLKELRHAMVNQIKPKKNYAKIYENRTDQYSLLIRLMYQHVSKEEHKKNVTYKKLSRLIYAMNHEEASIIIIIASETLYQNHYYQESADILMMMEKEDEISEELLILKRKMILLNACKLHRFLDIITYKDEFIKTATTNHYFKMLREFNLAYLLLLSYYKDPKTFIGDIKPYEYMSKDYFLYLKANSYYYHQEPQIAIDYLSQMKKRVDDAECLYLLCLERLNRIEEIIHIVTDENERKSKSRSLNIIRNYFLFKHNQSNPNMIEYIKSSFLGYGSTTDDFLILKYLQSEADFFFTSEHHYKDALSSYKRFSQMINQLKTALLRQNNKD